MWLKTLIFNLNLLSPKQSEKLIVSHISNSLFKIEQGNKYFAMRELKSGVPQGNVLGLTLYLLCTNDLLKLNVTVVTF